jgi:hypothetical protein
MVLNEDELRQHLAAAAEHVSAPRFTLEGLSSRIRRRRAKILGLVSGSLLAVAAIAVAVPVALSGMSPLPAKHAPPKLPPRLSFTVAVNGQSRVFPKNGPPPGFTVTPGEDLRIDVDVTVPAHHEVTALWLGISGVVLGPLPSGLHPILAHTRKPLGPGSHRFRLRWTVPAGLQPGTLRYVAGAWDIRQVHTGGFIAGLTVHSP